MSPNFSPIDAATDSCMIVQGSGRYPSLQEPGKPANPSVQTNPGNHAYPPTGDATASSADKSSASQTSNPDTSVNPANHAYPPTAGVSSAPKPSGSAKQSSGTSPSGADSNSAGSSTAYTPQGKDAKVNQAGSKSAAGSSSTPSTSSSSPSSSASASQGQPQSGNAPAKGPAAPAYKPMGASAPLNAEGASSSNPRPPTAGQPLPPIACAVLARLNTSWVEKVVPQMCGSCLLPLSKCLILDSKCSLLLFSSTLSCLHQVIRMPHMIRADTLSSTHACHFYCFVTHQVVLQRKLCVQ